MCAEPPASSQTAKLWGLEQGESDGKGIKIEMMIALFPILQPGESTGRPETQGSSGQGGGRGRSAKGVVKSLPSQCRNQPLSSEAKPGEVAGQGQELP